METPLDKLSEKVAENIAKLKAGEAVEPIASFLQMRLLELSPGYARVVLKLKPEYLTFNGVVFGGIIMAVADQAFAYASNSLALPSVATQFNIHLVAAPGAEDELTGECRVLHNGRHIGVSEMKIVNQQGKVIAWATGTTIPQS